LRLSFFVLVGGGSKSERGRKKGEASSNIRRKKTWKAQKLTRASAALSS
jgi:hypothetical protein